MLYVVGVVQGNNVGIECTTNNPSHAINTAYQLDGNIGILVYCFKTDMKYLGGPTQKLLGTSPSKYPIVFRRTRRGKKWREEWFDPKLKSKFVSLPAPMH